LRIIGGSHRGRRYQAPSSIPARPTTDYAKESLFNIIENRIDWTETSMLDLFAGIGGITIEAASRGCKSIASIDQNHASIKWITQVSRDFGFQSIQATKSEARKWLNRCQDNFDLVFADPPYDYEYYEVLIDLVLKTALKPSGTFVMEHRQSDSFAEHSNFVEERTYGEVRFTFFEC